jgi:hypothetical protein
LEDETALVGSNSGITDVTYNCKGVKSKGEILEKTRLALEKISKNCLFLLLLSLSIAALEPAENEEVG